MTAPDSLPLRRALRFLGELGERRQRILEQLQAPPPAPPEPVRTIADAPLTAAEEDSGYAETEQLLAGGQRQAALEKLQTLAARGAIRWEIHNDLGSLLLEAGDAHAALQALRTAVSLEFSSTHALRNLIVACVGQGELANALAASALLLRREPGNPDIPVLLRDLLLEAGPRLDDYAWLSTDLTASLAAHAERQARAEADRPRQRAAALKAELFEACTDLPQPRREGRFDWQAPKAIGHQDNRSCLLFIPPTCGSASVYRIMEAISRHYYRYLNFQVEAQLANTPLEGELTARHGYPYELTGTIYSWKDSQRLRESLDNSLLSPRDFRHLLILRDPRDSLVSFYHILRDPRHLPPPELTAYQETARKEKERLDSLSLDDYVLQNAAAWCRNIDGQARLLKDVPPEQVEFLSYAVLSADFPRFLARLTAFLQIRPRRPVLDHLLRTEDVRKKDTLLPQSLAHFTHASPQPGRHRRELRPATITALNRITAGTRAWMAALEAPGYRHLYDD